MSESIAFSNEFTAFWNNVLVDKFERFRNVLLDGLSYHSQVPLKNLKLAPGSRVRSPLGIRRCRPIDPDTGDRCGAPPDDGVTCRASVM